MSNGGFGGIHEQLLATARKTGTDHVFSRRRRQLLNDCEKRGLSPISHRRRAPRLEARRRVLYAGAFQYVAGGGDHGWADFGDEVASVLRFAGCAT